MLSTFHPNIKSDNFVLAVSGGVDSVVLLHLLSKLDYSFVVAHYDHGIRKSSSDDRRFVQDLATKYNRKFYYEEGKLGPDASEELARDKRYEFLKKIQKETGANLIVTAHHQDDEIETAMINILRGTGRLGLSSLQNNPTVQRPLLGFLKTEIMEYAIKNKLEWVEDSTNLDTTILRNYLRIKVIPKMTQEQKKCFLNLVLKAEEINNKIEPILSSLSNRLQHKGGPVISRASFLRLDDRISREIIHYLLRLFKYKNYDKKTIDLIVVGIKTLKSGKVIDIPGGKIILTKRSARFY